MDGIKYYVSDKDSLASFLTVAFEHKLYVNRRYLLYRFLLTVAIEIEANRRKVSRLYSWQVDKVKHHRPFWICCLALTPKNEPIGLLFFHGSISMLYLRPEYRKGDIGKTLYQEAAKKYDLGSMVYNLGTARYIRDLSKKLGLGINIKHRNHQTKLTNS